MNTTVNHELVHGDPGAAAREVGVSCSNVPSGARIATMPRDSQMTASGTVCT